MVGWSTALLVTLLAGAEPVVPVNAGNALTLPAQRHALRMDPGGGKPPVWLLAVQQSGREGRGLSFYRSADGRTFQYAASIQSDATHTDRADLVAVGNDIALVYSWESPHLTASSRHDVYFQWWRYRPDTHDWAPQPAVRIFDADSSTAFTRALLARDSKGRLWVQAFRLESNGSSTAVLSVSTDGGKSFQKQSNLGSVKRRGGGRLLSVGSKLLFVYAMHDGFEPTRMRIRDDDDPVGTWGPVRQAFSEGIYHGAALSAVADGQGGMHLVYKDEKEHLYYRRFDGESFGARTLLDSSADWAMQPAVTLVGSKLYVFYNSMRKPDTSYQVHARVMENGSFSAPVVLDTRADYKGYPTAVATLPESVSEVPCFFGNAPNTNASGQVIRVARPGPGGGGGGSPPPPPPDESEEPAPGGVLFSDTFSRTASSGLGSQWTLSGLWRMKDQRAVSDLHRPSGTNLALAPSARCRDCQVKASLQAFGVNEAGLVLRAQGEDRYSLAYLANGRIQVRRHRGGSVTVLGEASSGQSSARESALFTLTATGTRPVRLTASVNGQPRLEVTDSSSSALSEAGLPGLFTPIAGVWFDDFEVRGVTAP